MVVDFCGSQDIVRLRILQSGSFEVCVLHVWPKLLVQYYCSDQHCALEKALRTRAGFIQKGELFLVKLCSIKKIENCHKLLIFALYRLDRLFKKCFRMGGSARNMLDTLPTWKMLFQSTFSEHFDSCSSVWMFPDKRSLGFLSLNFLI